MFLAIYHLCCFSAGCRSGKTHRRPSRNGTTHHYTGSLTSVVGFKAPEKTKDRHGLTTSTDNKRWNVGDPPRLGPWG
jgi:hypothetical protein